MLVSVTKSPSSEPVSIVAEPKLRPLEKNLDVHFGDSIGIACSAIEGDTPIIFQWTKDGYPANILPRVTIVQGNVYSSMSGISQATLEYSGKYSCQATNSVGLATTIMQLEVHGKQNSCCCCKHRKCQWQIQGPSGQVLLLLPP